MLGVLFFGKQVNLVHHKEVWVGVCTDVFEPFFCVLEGRV